MLCRVQKAKGGRETVKDNAFCPKEGGGGG